MTKTELVEQMAKDAGSSKSAANKAVNSFIDCVKIYLERPQMTLFRRP
jgi:nucleoid DNA-binding protein